VAIARGLLPDPPVVLFDEATRSLDPGRAVRVRRAIKEILVRRGNKAVLFATHDLDEAKELSDRVVLMVEGRIEAEGPYDALEPKLKEVFEKEAEKEDAEYRRMFPEAAA
jgi:ABC-type multidrug transport system ATPase subunit